MPDKPEPVSRRDFLKKSATAGTATVAGLAALGAPEAGRSQSLFQSKPHDAAAPLVQEQRLAILLAIGDTLIPSASGDPGYRDLEWYGITAEVNRRLEDLADEQLDLFNRSSVDRLGKLFAELDEGQRAEYFELVLKEEEFKDKTLRENLLEVYHRTREVVFTVYYTNFPENRWPLDAQRVPLLKPGDEHQITNPNTSAVVTGWDVSGYAGPLTWEEEERRRNYFKKIRWQD